MTKPHLLMTDRSIIKIVCFWDSTMILKNNGEYMGLGNCRIDSLLKYKISKKMENFEILICDPSLSLICNGTLKSKKVWDSLLHSTYPFDFRCSVYCFVCCLKLKQSENYFCFKIPKFILFEIIKKLWKSLN